MNAATLSWHSSTLHILLKVHQWTHCFEIPLSNNAGSGNGTKIYAMQVLRLGRSVDVERCGPSGVDPIWFSGFGLCLAAVLFGLCCVLVSQINNHRQPIVAAGRKVIARIFNQMGLWASNPLLDDNPTIIQSKRSLNNYFHRYLGKVKFMSCRLSCCWCERLWEVRRQLISRGMWI